VVPEPGDEAMNFPQQFVIFDQVKKELEFDKEKIISIDYQRL
jgi:hypothetical protein